MKTIQVMLMLLAAVPTAAQEATTTTTFGQLSSAGRSLTISVSSSDSKKLNGTVALFASDEHNVNRVGVLANPDDVRLFALQLLQAADTAEADADARPQLKASMASGRFAKYKAKTDQECQALPACQSRGDCTAIGPLCIAARHGDCTQSTICKDFGRCIARNGQCESGKPAALDSEVAAIMTFRKSQLTLENARYECRRADECFKDGVCGYDGKHCLATSDDDCARSLGCMRDNKCKLKAGKCSK